MRASEFTDGNSRNRRDQLDPHRSTECTYRLVLPLSSLGSLLSSLNLLSEDDETLSLAASCLHVRQAHFLDLVLSVSGAKGEMAGRGRAAAVGVENHRLVFG